jgi:hypothetical protein
MSVSRHCRPHPEEAASHQLGLNLLQSATLLSRRHCSRLQRELRQYSRSFSLPVSPACAVAGVIRPHRKRCSLLHLKFQNEYTNLQVSPPVYTNLHVLPPTGRGVPSQSQVMEAKPEVDSSLSIRYAMQAMSGASGARSSPRLSPRVNSTPPLEFKSQLAELRRMHAEIEVANVSSSSHQVQERRQSQYEGALSQMHRPAHEQVNVAPHFEPILKQKASLIRTHPHPQQLQRRAAQAPTGGGVEKKTETSMERLRDVKVPQLSFPDSILADRDHTAQAVVRSSDPHEVPHPQGRRGAGV